MKCRLKLAVLLSLHPSLLCLVIILTHITSQHHNLNWIHDEQRWDEMSIHGRKMSELEGNWNESESFSIFSPSFSPLLSHSSEIEWISFTVMMLQTIQSRRGGKWKQFSSFIPSSWVGGSAFDDYFQSILFDLQLTSSLSLWHAKDIHTQHLSCEEHALFWILNAQHSSSGRNNNTQEEKLRMTNVTLSEFCSPFADSKHVHEVFLLHNFS